MQGSGARGPGYSGWVLVPRIRQKPWLGEQGTRTACLAQTGPDAGLDIRLVVGSRAFFPKVRWSCGCERLPFTYMGPFQETGHGVTLLLSCVTLVCGSVPPHPERGGSLHPTVHFRTRGCAWRTRGRHAAKGSSGASLGLSSAQLQQDPRTWGVPWAQAVPGQTQGRARSAQADLQTSVCGGD